MSDTKKTELAPCPFCGKTPRLSAKGGIVCCSNLLCDIFSLHVGIEAWNTRPNDAKWISVNDELIEKCAEAVHKAYCDYHIKNKGEEYWTRGDYSLLDEATKQIDRETVKAVLEICKQSSEEMEKL